MSNLTAAELVKTQKMGRVIASCLVFSAELAGNGAELNALSMNEMLEGKE